MHHNHWQHAVVSLLILGTLSWPVLAEPAESMDGGLSPAHASYQAGYAHGAGSFTGRLEHAVGLTPEQRDTVRGLLAQQHQQMMALRESISPKYEALQQETDGKIRALLNPEQQKKFDTFLAQQKAARARHRTARS